MGSGAPRWLPSERQLRWALLSVVTDYVDLKATCFVTAMFTRNYIKNDGGGESQTTKTLVKSFLSNETIGMALSYSTKLWIDEFTGKTSYDSPPGRRLSVVRDLDTPADMGRRDLMHLEG